MNINGKSAIILLKPAYQCIIPTSMMTKKTDSITQESKVFPAKEPIDFNVNSDFLSGYLIGLPQFTTFFVKHKICTCLIEILSQLLHVVTDFGFNYASIDLGSGNFGMP